MRKAFFLVFFFSFALVKTGESAGKSPFLWIAEKEGKLSYLLGTIHIAVSLDEMPCSDQVVYQIENSDLLFLEIQAQDVEKLSEEEEQKIYIGSREEQEKILSKLSLKTQEMIRERKIAFDHFLRTYLPFRLQSQVKEGAFSELSLESQKILIKYGADPKGDYADFFQFIRTFCYYKAYFSLPSMDKLIKKLALSHSVEIKALDNSKKINKDVHSQGPSDKPFRIVHAMEVEAIIENMDNLVNHVREKLFRGASHYKTYDLNTVEQTIIKSHKTNEDIFFKKRNELWLEKFLSAHREYERIFLAVGLAHLVGNYNLLDMLEENGFSIERMVCFE